MEKKQRKQKVSADQVLELLKENGGGKIHELSSTLEISPMTFRKRLRELRERGIPILPTNEGIILIDIVNENNKDSIMKAGTWITGEIIGMSTISNATKRPLLQIRKIIALTPDQRKTIKKQLLYITRMIDVAEIEEETA